MRSQRTPQSPTARSHPQLSTLQKQATMVERLANCILKSKFAEPGDIVGVKASIKRTEKAELSVYAS